MKKTIYNLLLFYISLTVFTLKSIKIKIRGVKVKTKRIFYVYLITILIIFPIVISVSAVAQSAYYIGSNENDEYIWDLTYDEELDKKMGDEMAIDRSVFDVDDDVKAWKHIITKIGNEKSYEGDKGVKYKLNKYNSEHAGGPDGDKYDWKLDEEGEEYIILKYEPDDPSILNHYVDCALFGAFYVATNVDWKEVLEELNDYEGGEYEATYNEYENSIKITIYEDYLILDDQKYEVGTIDVWCDYTNNGILEFYEFEWKDTIIKLELRGSRDSFWINYWLWVIIGIIALAAVIIVIIYIYVIKGKRPILKKREAKFY